MRSAFDALTLQSVALHFMYYNFVRRQQTLRISPAMAVGVSAKLSTIEDVVALID